jgi:hypothetical protein
MHWEILIIPLIALGVWILGTLFKTGEDDKMKRGVRRPGSVAGRGPSRRPVTDLDRFLEEARRRREQEERPKPPPAPPPARASVARPPLRERPTRPRETPPRVAAPVIRAPEAPVALPVARPIEQPAFVEPVVAATPPRDVPSSSTPAPATRPVPTSPILQQVRSLLSKPQTAGTAFVLREIFDRPLCMRRR